MHAVQSTDRFTMLPFHRLFIKRDGESSDPESTGEGCIISHSLHDLSCIGCSSVQVPTWSQLVSSRATERQTGTSSTAILLVSGSAIEREGRRQEEEKALHGKRGAWWTLLRFFGGFHKSHLRRLSSSCTSLHKYRPSLKFVKRQACHTQLLESPSESSEEPSALT